MVMKSYRELLAWQKAMALAEMAYVLSSSLPAEERYGLVSQLRRAAVSIPSNIAEGHARESTKEFIRFIAIARGSLAEVETQIDLIGRLKMLEQADLTPVLDCCDELGRILRGLKKSLNSKITSRQH
jgi:four helix bundle protein